MKQSDFTQQHIRIIPVGTVVYSILSNKIIDLEVIKVSIVYDENGCHVGYLLRDLGRNYSDRSFSTDEMFSRCSLTKEDCIKQFLSTLGVKGKIDIDLE